MWVPSKQNLTRSVALLYPMRVRTRRADPSKSRFQVVLFLRVCLIKFLHEQ
jgi:hypothetical protein